MSKKRLTEKDLMDDLDAHTAHADELTQPLPQELTPLERLKGSAKRYEHPLDPVWDEWFESEEHVTRDFMHDRDQPPKGRKE
ncbi:antitoxin VapB [Marinobacter pelagius]|uniref:Antitoxin VapB n=1 Tax=Marinobacter pelagius TaxID=379482 RepID=A0A366GKW9_9GAMM|nr:hypothetical protein [Marinobacter pelagius]RBP27915.1 antitoxin VapB [Marinobacter pelagius]